MLAKSVDISMSSNSLWRSSLQMGLHMALGVKVNLHWGNGEIYEDQFPNSPFSYKLLKFICLHMGYQASSLSPSFLFLPPTYQRQGTVLAHPKS